MAGFIRRLLVNVVVLALAVLALTACTGGRSSGSDPSPAERDVGRQDDAEERADEQPGAPLPQPRTEIAGAVWQGRIVVVGGLDEQGRAVDRVDVYDPAADVWKRGPDLPLALHHTGVATLDERVYVVGGYSTDGDAWEAQASVYSLGPDEGAWRQEPSLGIPRGALAVTSTGEQLVAIGGVNGGQVLASTERHESGGESWEPGPELDTSREHLAATAVDDAVYAIAGRAGGLDANHASVEVLRGSGWERAGELATPRGGIGAATVDGVPCVAGGEEPGGTIATVECRRDGDWRVEAELEVARHGLVVAALDGVLHVIGGGTEPGLTVSGAHERVAPSDS